MSKSSDPNERQTKEQALQKVKEDKMKETKSKYLQNFMWEDPFILSKSRGVVGVPTNGNILGEPVIFVCLLED